MSGRSSSSAFGVLSRKHLSAEGAETEPSLVPNDAVAHVYPSVPAKICSARVLKHSTEFLLASVVLRPTKEQPRAVTFSVGSSIITGVLLTFNNRWETCVLSVLLGSCSSPTFNPWNSVWFCVSESRVVLLGYHPCALIGCSCLAGLYTRDKGFNHLFLLFSL